MAGRKHIVLYNPVSVFYAMPLALLSVAATLDRRRYAIHVIDGRFYRHPIESLLEVCRKASILGITVLTGAPIGDALRFSRAVRKAYPRLPIVWGGWHPSLFPVETLAEPSINISVQGQGERTFYELVEALEESRLPYAIRGICWRSPDGTIVSNPPRPLEDINHESGFETAECGKFVENFFSAFSAQIRGRCIPFLLYNLSRRRFFQNRSPRPLPAAA